MTDSTVDLSIIILSWNTRDLTVACLTALKGCLEAFPSSAEVIVIDNASADDSVDALQCDFPWVDLHINDDNVGYARGVNQGLDLARGRRVMLLGSDTEVRGETLPLLWAFLDEHPDVGMVAPRCVDPDGTLQRGCMRFPNLMTALYYDTFLEKVSPNNTTLHRYFYKDWDHLGTRAVDQPPATCVMVRREVIDEVGPMDRRLWGASASFGRSARTPSGGPTDRCEHRTVTAGTPALAPPVAPPHLAAQPVQQQQQQQQQDVDPGVFAVPT